MYKYKKIFVYDEYHNLIGSVKEKPRYPIHKSTTPNYDIDSQKVYKKVKNNKKSLI